MQEESSITELIERAGGPTKFSRLLNIPLKTVQNWKQGIRKAPEWTVTLIQQRIEQLEQLEQKDK